MAWLGVVLCIGAFFKLIWDLLHADEVMIRVSGEGVWITGSNGGTTIPWGMVDDIYRARGKQEQFLVLKIADEKYKSLNRGIVQVAIFQLNKFLRVQGMPLNIAGATVSHEQFESWVIGCWNDWKERQVELGLKGKAK